MIKNTILTFIFLAAICAGMGVGYGTTRAFNFTYKTVAAYAGEIKTTLQNQQVTEIAKGGPESQDVIESEFNQTTEQEVKNFEINGTKKITNIFAMSYLVADLESGKVLTSQNINQQLPIASVTKLMTAIVADETLGLDTKTTVTSVVVDTYGAQGNLKKGESYSVLELFYPLLLESSNDAAEALAYAKNRSQFIGDMNGKAKSIGLLNTIYEDASGLSPNNKSTVTDLFRLAQYISKYREYIFDISTEKKKVLGKKTWSSNSRFRSDSDYVGGKNGYTDEALKTQVVLFEENFEKGKRTIAYIVLRSTDIGSDIRALRDYVHKNVEYK